MSSHFLLETFPRPCRHMIRCSLLADILQGVNRVVLLKKIEILVLDFLETS
jgi:hypothetical protein